MTMPCNYKNYPFEWKQIRARILERAGDKCETCGVPNHSWILRTGDQWCHTNPTENDGGVYVVLTVAHLDHDTHNNADDNLRALCQLHHNRHDVEHRKATRAETDKANRTAPLFEETRP